MTATRKLAALVAGGALMLAGCGESDSGDSASSAAGNGTDRAFAADMVPHHASAIDMAEIALKRGKSAFVKDLARDIVATQTAEISTLRTEDEGLATAGIKPGSLGVPAHMMGMDGDVATLETAAPFDAAFLELMIPHHEGAIEMAKAELKQGEDPQLKALAQDIITAQQREIDAMREQLGDAAPATHDAMGHG
jgi:uncharacterized protein (DUF305 family)